MSNFWSAPHRLYRAICPNCRQIIGKDGFAIGGSREVEAAYDDAMVKQRDERSLQDWCFGCKSGGGTKEAYLRERNYARDLSNKLFKKIGSPDQLRLKRQTYMTYHERFCRKWLEAPVGLPETLEELDTWVPFSQRPKQRTHDEAIVISDDKGSGSDSSQRRDRRSQKKRQEGHYQARADLHQPPRFPGFGAIPEQTDPHRGEARPVPGSPQGRRPEEELGTRSPHSGVRGGFPEEIGDMYGSGEGDRYYDEHDEAMSRSEDDIEDDSLNGAAARFRRGDHDRHLREDSRRFDDMMTNYAGSLASSSVASRASEQTPTPARSEASYATSTTGYAPASMGYASTATGYAAGRSEGSLASGYHYSNMDSEAPSTDLSTTASDRSRLRGYQRLPEQLNPEDVLPGRRDYEIGHMYELDLELGVMILRDEYR